MLSHLNDPEGAVAAWASQLAPGGVLTLEDVEWIRTSHPVLVAYLRLAEDLLAARGAQLFVGLRLHAVLEGLDWRQRQSHLEVLEVPTATAAELFAQNLAVWRADPWIQHTCHPEEIDDLARGIDDLRDSCGENDISWGLRQVLIERLAEPDS